MASISQGLDKLASQQTPEVSGGDGPVSHDSGTDVEVSYGTPGSGGSLRLKRGA
jgi:hypothetical protein